MTDTLTDRERALCREAAVEAVRLYCEEHLGPPNCDSAPNPDPAPEPRTVTTSHGQTYRCVDGRLDLRLNNGTWWPSADYTADNVRLLASLLPKRELTDEIVENVSGAFMAPKEFVRFVLLSVWDDIAAPAPALKPQWWGVVTADGKAAACFDDPNDAQERARWYAEVRRVVALAEVPHAS